MWFIGELISGIAVMIDILAFLGIVALPVV
jgi:hypothetical protein